MEDEADGGVLGEVYERSMRDDGTSRWDTATLSSLYIYNDNDLAWVRR